MNLVLFLLCLLGLAVALAPIAERLKLPVSSVFVLLGFAVSELVTMMGIDTGLRWRAFHELVFFLLLPALIFEGALHIRVRKMLADLVPILSLAVPFLLISTLVCAFALYYLIGHPTGFPWAAALFTGAILSATDPVAVLALFRKLDAPPRLSLLIDGESLFNDASAVVIAMIVLSLAMSGSDITGGGAVVEFLRVFFGGVLTGAGVGLITAVLLLMVRDRYATTAISLSAAYGSFILGEDVLNVSGVMATLAAALILSWRLRTRHRDRLEGTLEVWASHAYLANALMFLIMGVTITKDMFTGRWLAMLIGILAAALARALVIYMVLPAAGRLPGFNPIPSGYRHVLYWGGLRGAVTIALALSLPLEFDWWFTAQSIAYGVVLFSLFVQAPTLPFVIRRTLKPA